AAMRALLPIRRSPRACGASSTGSALIIRSGLERRLDGALCGDCGHDRMTVTGVSHRGWARRNLAWFLFLLMLAVFAAGRLVGPRIADDQQKYWCAVNVHI